MSYTIRAFRDDDAGVLVTLCRKAILAIGSRYYIVAQIEAWLAGQPDENDYLQRVRQGAIITIAADADDRPVAYVLLEPDGHVGRLYAHPAHTRMGLADRLIAAAETQARTNRIARLYTEASELARAAFERRGFVVTARRDFEVRGVAIHNYAMEKRFR